MRQLVWSAEASDELDEIVEFISERNEAAAIRLLDLIEHTAEQIPLHPFMYRPGRKAGTREAVVHPNYLLVYEVTDEEVTILSVLHARRRYP